MSDFGASTVCILLTLTHIMSFIVGYIVAKAANAE